jgi:hypothetical protein
MEKINWTTSDTETSWYFNAKSFKLIVNKQRNKQPFIPLWV